MKGKDLRKQWKQVGLGLGFGLVVGKFFGDCLAALLSGIGTGMIEEAARNGNKFCQRVCDKTDVKYDKPEDKEPEDEE